MKVLDEEEYISSLSKIIARDFYPLTSAAQPIEGSSKDTTSKDGLSLDEFQTKYTSADNSSFNSLSKKEKEERESKIPSMYPQKLLQSSDKGSIKTWDYKLKNSLMFLPESIESFTETKKSISHSNTRLDLMPPPLIVPPSKPLNPGHPNNPKPLVENTPLIEPGSLFNPSELLTWGNIESTPIRLDYEIPPTPKRDLLLMDLSKKKSKDLNQKSDAYQRLRKKHKK
jgi:protein DGCR14